MHVAACAPHLELRPERRDRDRILVARALVRVQHRSSRGGARGGIALQLLQLAERLEAAR